MQMQKTLEINGFQTTKTMITITPTYVTIAETGKRLAPVIIYRTTGDVTAINIRQPLKFSFIIFLLKIYFQYLTFDR